MKIQKGFMFLWEYLVSKVGELLPMSSSIVTTSLTVHLHPWRQFRKQLQFHGTIKNDGPLKVQSYTSKIHPQNILRHNQEMKKWDFNMQ